MWICFAAPRGSVCDGGAKRRLLVLTSSCLGSSEKAVQDLE